VKEWNFIIELLFVKVVTGLGLNLRQPGRLKYK